MILLCARQSIVLCKHCLCRNTPLFRTQFLNPTLHVYKHIYREGEYIFYIFMYKIHICKYIYAHIHTYASIYILQDYTN